MKFDSLAVLLLTLNHFYISEAFPSLGKPKYYQIKRFRLGPCQPNQARFPYKFLQKDSKFSSGIDSFTYENKFELLEDMYAPFQANVTVNKCNFNNGADCELLTALTIPNFCNEDSFSESPMLRISKMISTHPTEPPLECPVNKKGKYVIKKAVYDLSPMSTFPLEGYWYKVQLVYMFGKTAEPLLCNDLDVTVNVVKNRRPKSKN